MYASTFSTLQYFIIAVEAKAVSLCYTGLQFYYFIIDLSAVYLLNDSYILSSMMPTPQTVSKKRNGLGGNASNGPTADAVSPTRVSFVICNKASYRTMFMDTLCL